MHNHYCAGGVVISGGKIAILKRYNGVWLLPKGHIDEGETAEMAALREVKEETGLDAEVIKLLGRTAYEYEEHGELHHKEVVWYLMRYIRGKLKREKEMFLEARWITENQINILTYPDDRRLAKEAWEWWKGEDTDGKD